jgi:transposase-like protein
VYYGFRDVTGRFAVIAEFDSLYDLFQAIPDEKAAIAYFTAIRWRGGEFCPHCGHDTIYHFSDGKTYKCAACRERFSIRVGTVFEGTKIEIRKWIATIWLITSHRKGIASTQLARDIHVTQKTAWFMLHRLRHAARTRSFNRPLRGIVEADETFVGGKDKNKHAHKRGKDEKVVVFGMLERGGELRAAPIDSLKDIKHEILTNVEDGANLMTDEWPGYQAVDKHVSRFAVNHSKGEYVRHFFAHVNGIEGVWSLLKRQIYGIHHWVSGKHLHRYVAESVWRYNRREVKDCSRIAEFLTRIDGRLKYKVLIAK